MTIIWLTRQQTKTIIDHARSAAPHEACGLILGAGHQVDQVVPAKNITTDPMHHFRVDDALVVQHFNQIIGVYHSHPRSAPVPSSTDIQESCYPEFIHVIIGLQGESPRLAAWRIRHGRVDSIQVHIDDRPPDNIPQQLTAPQVVALLVGTLAVALVVLLISLMLLPPAPPIP